jgi:hypothetical protein
VLSPEAVLASPLLRAPARVEASEMSCTPPAATGGSTCVFRRLYLRDGIMYFAVDAASDAAAAAAVTVPDVALSTDSPYGGWGGNAWVTGIGEKPSLGPLRPRVVATSTVAAWVAGGGGGTPPALTDYPLLLTARLNPTNAYHMVWDDFNEVHALACHALALFGAAAGGTAPVSPLTELAAEADVRAGAAPPDPDADVWGGCIAGVVPPIAVAFMDGFHAMHAREYLAWACAELHFEWPPLPPPGTAASGGVAVMPFVVAGSQGACTHIRYCTNELAAGAHLHFKRHVLANYGILSALPPAALGAAREIVVVRRKGRRSVLNLDALADVVRTWGYSIRFVGPFAGWSFEAQVAAFANASGVLMAAGAEVGPMLVGLPRGACAVLLQPAGAPDIFFQFVADKLRVRTAAVMEAFTRGDDPRIGRPQAENYQTDMTVLPGTLYLGAWCLSQAPAGTRGAQKSPWTEFVDKLF